jgi:hypothetical protein
MAIVTVTRIQKMVTKVQIDESHSMNELKELAIEIAKTRFINNDYDDDLGGETFKTSVTNK